MFKNLSVFRIGADFFPSMEDHESALGGARFTPCGATQDKSAGWVEPRGEAHGALVESVAGQRIMKLMVETKAVPGALVREKAQEEADRIEALTGRKPGKREMKELREDALLALLPQAFPRRASVWVWVDLKAGLVLIDSTSQNHIDETITALVRAFQGLSLHHLQTAVTPQTAMTQWLSASCTGGPEVPDEFTIERACELKSRDESKATVKFNHHNLMIDEVRKHIAEGKLPVSLALSYDGRMAFTLTDSGRIKSIGFMDGAITAYDKVEGDADAFDGDVTLATGELQLMLPALVSALGGELGAGEDLT